MSFEMSLAVLATITGLAAWKGEWPERSVAAILVASLVADQLFHWRFPDTITYVTVDLWHLAIFLQAPYWLAMVLLLWGTTNLQWLRAHERRRLARRAARGGGVS